MADGYILECDSLVEVFIYEGEDIAIEYPDGTTFKIPPNLVHMVLRKAILPSGEPCHILYKLSPITRLPIVVLESQQKENSYEQL